MFSFKSHASVFFYIQNIYYNTGSCCGISINSLLLNGHIVLIPVVLMLLWAVCISELQCRNLQISWTHALRQIVINCYKYHGREDLLPAFTDDDDKTSGTVGVIRHKADSPPSQSPLHTTQVHPFPPLSVVMWLTSCPKLTLSAGNYYSETVVVWPPLCIFYSLHVLDQSAKQLSHLSNFMVSDFGSVDFYYVCFLLGYKRDKIYLSGTYVRFIVISKPHGVFDFWFCYQVWV